MAFNDNPIVDANAKRSEESVLAVRSLFSKKNKFLSREETPDYGVDLDVELIDDKSSVTHERFAIQIKSTEKKKKIKVKDIEYISLTFKTSRLGYLAKRLPGLGLIVLYEENTRELYFDYIEEIINRIQLERQDDKWKQQDEVNIHFPINNRLNKTAVVDIYDKFKRRFENHVLLLKQHGKKYEILTPLHHQFDKNKFLADLEKYGASLINKQDFSLLHQIISSLKISEIRSSHKLCLWAAITFCETGDVIEAKHYFSRCNQYISKYSEHEREILIFSEPKADFLLGNISLKEYGIVLEKGKSKIKSQLHFISVEMNLFQMEISDAITNKKYEVEFENRLIQFLEKILIGDFDIKTKNSLITQHCDTILGYASAFLCYELGDHKLREALDNELPNNQKKKILERYFNVKNLSEDNLKIIFIVAQKENNELLKAEILLIKGKFFFNHNMNLSFINENPLQSEDLKSDYLGHLNNLYISYNIFIESQKIIEAHQSLNYALDIQRLYGEIYNTQLGEVSEKELVNLITQIEQKTGINRYKSYVSDAFNFIKKNSQQNFKVSSTNSTDEEIEQRAMIYLEASDLPIDRLPNIIFDMTNHRGFYQKNKNEDILLLQDLRHTLSKDTKYKNSPIYILKSKKTGLETPPSSNVNELLNYFNKIL